MTDDETDESSTDDRMDRANRIREMREGRRGRDDDGASDSPEGGPAASDHADTHGTDDTDGTRSAGDDGSSGPGVEAVDDLDGSTGAGGFEFDERGGTGADAAGDSADTAAGTDPETDTDAGSAADPGGHEDRGGRQSENGSGSEARSSDVADSGSVVDPVADDRTGSRPGRSTDAGAGVGIDADLAERAAESGLDATFRIPEQATTVTETEKGAMVTEAEQTVAAARAAAASGRTHATGSGVRVLEFVLSDERFCLDIDYIEEIVELENVTRVPNSPSYVEGVVDLRGQVTAIINPKDALDVADDDDLSGKRVVVFDSEKLDEQGHIGWLVDEVKQVTPVAEEDVNESPDEDEEYINGIINREDEDDFIVWTTPDLALNSS